MSAWNELITVKLVESLGWALVHSVWQLAGLCALAALLLRAMRRRSPQARYAVACLMLATMVVVPVASCRWLVPGSPTGSASEAVAFQDGPGEPVLADDMGRNDEIERLGNNAPSIASLSNEQATATDTSLSWIAVTTRTIRPALPWLVGLWGVGFALIFLYHLGGWMAVGQLRRRGVRPVADSLVKKVERLARQLGIRQTVTLWESTLARVPMVVGCWRPVVLLPVSVVTGLSSTEIEAILAHELVHVGRHDYLVNLLQTVAETLLFFHPAVWWLSGRIRLEREYCADRLAAAAVGNRAGYAAALATLAERCTGVPNLAVAATGSQLRSRILYLARGSAAGSAHGGSLLIGTAACLAMVATMFFLAPGQNSLATASAADATDSAEVPSAALPPQRVLHFPKDRSLGAIWLHDAGAKRHIDTYFYWWKNNFESKKHGEARGDVVIPAGKLVSLSVSPEARHDLSPLADLPPDAIYSVVFAGALEESGRPQVTDDAMKYVRRLTGLKELGLHFTRVTDRGLSELKHLKQLEQLYLPPRTTNSGLAVLKELPSLKRLYFSETRVTNRGLAHLAKLESLEELDLGGERIDDKGLVHLTKLPKLEYLLLWGLNFTDKGLAHVAKIRSLRVLSLPSIDTYTDEGLKHVATLPGLENLSAASNSNLTDAGMAYLTKSRTLRKLDIGRYGQESIQQPSRITPEGFKHLAAIKTLVRLDIFNRPIGDEGLAYLSTLPNLRVLQIPQPSYLDPGIPWDFYTDAGLAHLSELMHLEELVIGGPGVTDAGMGPVGRMTSLKCLTISLCPISDAGLPPLEGLENLKSLSITSDAELSDAAVADLRRKLPTSEIQYSVLRSGRKSP